MTKREVSKMYDNKTLVLDFNKSECEALSWSMYYWQNAHCDKYRCCEYTEEQYHRAYKKRVVNIYCQKHRITK